MGRKSKLTPDQWADVDRRLAADEAPSALAREYGVAPSAMTRRRISQRPEIVAKVAEQLAAAQTALAALPMNQQYTAMSLAEGLRGIARDLTAAAAYGADTARRLKERANVEAARILAATDIDVSKMSLVAGLTKLANESAASGHSLMASASSGTLKQVQLLEQGTPEKPEEGADDDMTPTFNLTLTSE